MISISLLLLFSWSFLFGSSLSYWFVSAADELNQNVDPNKIAQFVFGERRADESVGPGLMIRLLRLWERLALEMEPEQRDQLFEREAMSDIIGLTNISPRECYSKDRLSDRKMIQLEYGIDLTINKLIIRLNELQFGLCVSLLDKNINIAIEKLAPHVHFQFSKMMHNDPAVILDTGSPDHRAPLKASEFRVDTREDPVLNTRARMASLRLAFLMKHQSILLRGSFWNGSADELRDDNQSNFKQLCSNLFKSSQFTEESIEFLEAIRVEYKFEKNQRWTRFYDICLLLSGRPEIFEQAKQLFLREFHTPRRALRLEYVDNFDKLLEFVNEPSIDLDTVLDGINSIDRYTVRSHLDTLDMIMRLVELYELQPNRTTRNPLDILLEISSVHGSKCHKEALTFRLEMADLYGLKPSLFHYIDTYSELQVDLCRWILVDAVASTLNRMDVDAIIQLDELSSLVRRADSSGGRAFVPLARWSPRWAEFTKGVAMWLYLNYARNESDESMEAIELPFIMGKFHDFFRGSCNRLVESAKSHNLLLRFNALVEAKYRWIVFDAKLSPLTIDTISYVVLCQSYYNMGRNFTEIYRLYLEIKSDNTRPRNTFEKLVDEFSQS